MRQPTLVKRWQSRSALVQDGVLAVLLTALAFIPPFGGAGVDLGGLPEIRLDALGVVLALGQSLPLVLRRRQPPLCLAVVTVMFAAHQMLGYPTTVAGIGLYVALYSLGTCRSRFRTAAAVAFTVAYAALSTALAALGSPESPVGFVTFFMVLTAFWGAGTWIRTWRTGEAERRRYEATMAVSRERARIARELHDVVTHHVTAMVVQADAAQYLLGDPDQLASGLGSVSGTGRRALTELRHLLDVLDASEDAVGAERTPAVGLIDDLVEQTRRAGQTVEMTQEGEGRAMGDGVELAVYRVVQEGLTNAVKHARSCPTTVRIRYGTDLIDVEVVTVGPEIAETVPGRGLTGLRERVGLLGGDLRAGGRPGGGFLVEARIPLRGAV